LSAVLASGEVGPPVRITERKESVHGRREQRCDGRRSRTWKGKCGREKDAVDGRGWETTPRKVRRRDRVEGRRVRCEDEVRRSTRWGEKEEEKWRREGRRTARWKKGWKRDEGVKGGDKWI
jgi:hypothetical protein